MFNDKGMTLIESLFAFQIFIVVIVLLATMYVNIQRSQKRIHNMYIELSLKEGEIQCQDSFQKIVEEALH